MKQQNSPKIVTQVGKYYFFCSLGTYSTYLLVWYAFLSTFINLSLLFLGIRIFISKLKIVLIRFSFSFLFLCLNQS